MPYSKENTRIENSYRVWTGLTHRGNCVVCGDAFACRSSRAKFCSARCANDNYINNRKRVKDEQRNKVCCTCQSGFKAKKVNAKYCSNRCRQMAHRKAKEVYLTTDKPETVTQNSFGKIDTTKSRNANDLSEI